MKILAIFWIVALLAFGVVVYHEGRGVPNNRALVHTVYQEAR
jgi:hypothetical protein